MKPTKKLSRSKSANPKDLKKLKQKKENQNKEVEQPSQNVKKKPKSKEKAVAKKRAITNKKSQEEEKEKDNLQKEIRATRDISTLSRIISQSEDILSQQKAVLEKCNEISKKIVSADYEIDRLCLRNENDDFPTFVDKYRQNLGSVMDQLKIYSEEVEKAKYLKEENQNLRYKLEMMTIDRQDSGLQSEAKLNTIQNLMSNEMNALNEIFVDMGFNFPEQKFSASNLTDENIMSYFQNLKRNIHCIKNRLFDQENEINVLNIEKKRYIDELRYQKENQIMKPSYTSSINLQSELTAKKNEEELMSYKNLLREYEQQIYDLKKINKSLMENEMCQSQMKSEEYSIIDNYRRNKEYRTDMNSSSEINLENKYSDSYFYKKDNKQNDYPNMRVNFYDKNSI